MRRRGVLMALLLLGGCSAAADPVTPRPSQEEQAAPRIVSINPCTDAILAELADPQQILAISHYSHDPRASSLPMKVARRWPSTKGSVEEVLALRPDMVIAGAHVGPATVDALHRLGIRLEQVPVANSVADSHRQIRHLARLVGHPARGEAMIRRIDAALAAAAPAEDAKPVPALIWLGGGLVPGQGTLADELMQRTGLDNASARHGLAQWDVLGLERLVARPPRLLLSTAAGPSQDDRMLGHPALASLSGEMTIAEFPQVLLYCAGPTIASAASRMADARRQVEARP